MDNDSIDLRQERDRKMLELFEKFKEPKYAREKYLMDPLFRKAADAFLHNADPILIIDNLINIINDQSKQILELIEKQK